MTMAFPKIEVAVFPGFERVPAVRLPRVATEGSAGLDLSPCRSYLCKEGEPIKLDTGLAIAIPTGYVGLILPRSSMMHAFTTTGVLDSDYRGHVKLLINPLTDFCCEGGVPIAQLVVIPCINCAIHVPFSTMGKTSRGTGGFGSTSVSPTTPSPAPSPAPLYHGPGVAGPPPPPRGRVQGGAVPPPASRGQYLGFSDVSYAPRSAAAAEQPLFQFPGLRNPVPEPEPEPEIMEQKPISTMRRVRSFARKNKSGE
uniref:dUTP diphosphatase n=1 Tax=Latid herpesvirus 1 TaxID=3096545 RepID=A0AB33V6P6_9VIRU